MATPSNALQEEEESVVEDAVQLAWKVVGKTATAELARMDQPHQIARYII